MKGLASRLLLWSPRILGILVALYIGLFALDSVGEGSVALLIHLVPALVLFVVVVMAWRWEWVGAMVFLFLALLYAATTLYRIDWILAISGPLLVVGLLFFWSWRHREGLSTRT